MKLVFTVDLDRDANIEVPGQTEAGSADRGEGTAPRFSSSGWALARNADMLDSIGMPAAFFCEGRTAEALKDEMGCLDRFELGIHGYDHENLTHRIPRAEAAAAVRHGFDAVKDVTGRTPSAFRAPYMHQPKAVAAFLRDTGTGILTDSSMYASGPGSFPFALPGYVAEVPVTEGTGPEGGAMSGYFWAMHEGKRPPEDYSFLAKSVPEDGTLVLADHVWHIRESRASGVRSDEDSQKELDFVSEVLRALMDAGAEPETLSDAASDAYMNPGPSDGADSE